MVFHNCKNQVTASKIFPKVFIFLFSCCHWKRVNIFLVLNEKLSNHALIDGAEHFRAGVRFLSWSVVVRVSSWITCGPLLVRKHTLLQRFRTLHRKNVSMLLKIFHAIFKKAFDLIVDI